MFVCLFVRCFCVLLLGCYCFVFVCWVLGGLFVLVLGSLCVFCWGVVLLVFNLLLLVFVRGGGVPCLSIFSSELVKSLTKEHNINKLQLVFKIGLCSFFPFFFFLCVCG